MDSLLARPRGSHTLSIQRNLKSNITDTVTERGKVPRHSSYSLVCAGFYGLNGTGTISTIQNICVPELTLLYGLEALVLERQELEVLSMYHRKNLHYIQTLPEATAIPALYLLIGTLPVKALIDIRALSSTELLQLTTVFHLQLSSRS